MIANIISPSVSRLTLLPEHDPDYEIRSIEIEGISIVLDQREDPVAELLSGISGKVVDIEGAPVAGFGFVLQPMELQNSFLRPDGGAAFQFHKMLGDVRAGDVPRPAVPAHSGEDGAFTVSNVHPGLLQLTAVSTVLLDAIDAVEVGKIGAGEEIPHVLLQHGRAEADTEIVSIQNRPSPIQRRRLKKIMLSSQVSVLVGGFQLGPQVIFGIRPERRFLKKMGWFLLSLPWGHLRVSSL